MPVRYRYQDDYFDTPMQGIPAKGFGAIFDALLADSRIEVRTGVDFFAVRDSLSKDAIVLYTGMIDRLFDHCFGALAWRSLRFEWETVCVRDFQGTSVMNYGDPDVPFTRIHEVKHYHPENAAVMSAPSTIICREYPQTWKLGDEPYYPVDTSESRERLSLYLAEAAKVPNLVVGGRLGEYRYYDIDRSIDRALEIAQQF